MPRQTVRLHPAQAEFRRSPALYRGFVGGRGAGKTHIGAYDLIRRAKPGRTYMIGSPTSIIMSDTTFPTFKRIARDDLGVWGECRLTPYPTVVLTTGATVRFRTTDDPERMRGPNLSGLWLDEASLMPRAAYDIGIASLREKGEQGWLSATFTPKGPTHWTYETFATGRPDTAVVRATTAANPFNPPGFADTLRRQYGDTPFARQELDGDFVQVEGAEFPAAWFHELIWFEDWPVELRYKVIYLDPSKGASKRSDYQAFVLAALDGYGTIWLDAVMEREPVCDMIARGVRLCREWGPVDSLALEDNGTMGFLAAEIDRQTREAGLPVPWQTVTNTDRKESRILCLGAYLSRAQVRLRDTPGGRLLRAQLGDWPRGDHDDGPDAAAGAVRRIEQLAAGPA